MGSWPSAEIIDSAKSLISHQGFTPASPGAMKPNGSVAYCAAAALAAAGLEQAGRTDRLVTFNAEIVTTKSSECIRRVFTELGWSEELCSRALILNDSLPLHERTMGVIRYLSEIGTEH